MNMIKRLGVLGLMGIAVLAVTIVPAAAQSVADFYKGKKITIWVGYSPGGGYDRYARTVARHMA